VAWIAKARYMAKARVQRFIVTLKEFEQLRQSEIAKGHTFDYKLEGGRSVAQKTTGDGRPNPVFSDPARPYSTIEGAHYVQARIVDSAGNPVPSNMWPEGFQRYVGDTMDNPKSWNQGIDKTIDNTQKWAIERYNSGVPIDKKFVKDYIQQTIDEINADRKAINPAKPGVIGKYQYSKMAPADIQAHLNELYDLMHDDSFLQAVANGEVPPV